MGTAKQKANVIANFDSRISTLENKSREFEEEGSLFLAKVYAELAQDYRNDRNAVVALMKASREVWRRGGDVHGACWDDLGNALVDMGDGV